eukprot:PhF_6_TR3452/c0_g1_i1/m.5035
MSWNRGWRWSDERLKAPRWLQDMALEFRIPAVWCMWYSFRTTQHYFDAQSYYKPDGKWTTAKGTVLDIERHTFRHHYLPRYSVQYTFTVDGKEYTSRRATTGSIYRNWIHPYLPTSVDAMTEAQYLQAIPPLRIGAPCTVFYAKSNPCLSGVAHDPSSYECSLIAFAGLFVFVWATQMKVTLFNKFGQKVAPKHKIRVPNWSGVFPEKLEKDAAASAAEKKG